MVKISSISKHGVALTYPRANEILNTTYFEGVFSPILNLIVRVLVVLIKTRTNDSCVLHCCFFVYVFPIVCVLTMYAFLFILVMFKYISVYA